MVMTDLFHAPKLGGIDCGLFRTAGPGLGNLLLPIARALIGREKHGGTFLYPTIRQIKIGPYLRREHDKRTYSNVFRARRWNEWQYWCAASCRPRIYENAFDGEHQGVTVEYVGLRNYFHDLVGHEALVESWLASNARSVGLIDGSYDVGLHVRRGDFRPVGSQGSGDSIQLALDWYASAVDMARKLLGVSNPEIVVFTDGDVDEIKHSLGLLRCTTDPSGNAMTAILNLAKARLLVTSRSTFSMWGAYLGRMPAIWDRQFSLEKTFRLRPGLDFRL